MDIQSLYIKINNSSMIDMKYDRETNTVNDEQVAAAVSIIEKHRVSIDEVIVELHTDDDVYGVMIDNDWSMLPQINKIKSKCRVNGLARYLGQVLPIPVKW